MQQRMRKCIHARSVYGAAHRMLREQEAQARARCEHYTVCVLGQTRGARAAVFTRLRDGGGARGRVSMSMGDRAVAAMAQCAALSTSRLHTAPACVAVACTASVSRALRCRQHRQTGCSTVNKREHTTSEVRTHHSRHPLRHGRSWCAQHDRRTCTRSTAQQA
jgi:hypothetical protein